MPKRDPADDLIQEPMDVRLLGEAVVVLGPDGVAIAISAEAAEESGRRLSAAARRSPRNAGNEGLKVVRVPPRARR